MPVQRTLGQTVPKSEIKNERQYEIDGKTAVIKPVYKENSSENVISILLKLIKIGAIKSPKSLDTP